MAPACDICHAYRPNIIWVSQHSLSINGKRKDITKNVFLEFANSINIKKADKIILEVNDKVSRWNDYADEVNVKAELRDAIHKTLIKM